MEAKIIFQKLEDNLKIITSSLQVVTKEEIYFRPHEEHWCLLEVICHLCDEEVEDFRTRVFHCLGGKKNLPPAFNPLKWVKERNYIDQDYDSKLRLFTKERMHSLSLLRNLASPDWENGYLHPEVGKLTAFHFLNNWLAHDLLHIRQITKIRYEFLRSTGISVSYDYAGRWVK